MQGSSPFSLIYFDIDNEKYFLHNKFYCMYSFRACQTGIFTDRISARKSNLTLSDFIYEYKTVNML